MKIPFSRPPIVGGEIENISQAFENGIHMGGGKFSKKTEKFIENEFNIGKVLLTTSCTDALEMAAILSGGKVDDEFIVPSYTFSSTANAFALRGMKPVFCDIDINTLNIDVNKISNLITNKTKAIVPIHYAGIPADMDKINKIAEDHKILVVEDAAQAVNSKYNKKYAGSLADLGTFSFHATKNYSCGEGGALCINNQNYFKRSDYLLEKGTDRSEVVAGLKNKYSWVDLGSSFLPSDLLASMLYTQLEKRDLIMEKRKRLHSAYVDLFKSIQIDEIKHILIPENVDPNYHAFWILLRDETMRNNFFAKCKEYNISSYIGYVPLHSSKMGIKVGETRESLLVTENISGRIVRLPFYLMNDDEINYVYDSLKKILKLIYK